MRRVEFQGSLKLRESGSQVAGSGQEDAQVVSEIGIGGLQGHEFAIVAGCLLKASRRRGRVAQLRQYLNQMLVRGRIFRIAGKQFAEAGRGVLEPALGGKSVGQIVSGAAVVGPNAKGVPELFDGLVELAIGLKRSAEGIERCRLVGLGAEGSAQMSDGVAEYPGG